MAATLYIFPGWEARRLYLQPVHALARQAVHSDRAHSGRKVEITSTTATTCCALPPAAERFSERHHPELSPARALGSCLVGAKQGLVVAW